MTITQQQLERAIAEAESMQGRYLVFAASTQDQQSQTMFQTMAGDAASHSQKLLMYSQWGARAEPKSPQLRNLVVAFICGGLVSCLLGEPIIDVWEAMVGISRK